MKSFILVLAAILASQPALGTINGFQFGGIEGVGGLTLNKRIGYTSIDKKHVINIEDCYAYQGGAIEIKWSLNRTPAAGTKWVVKMSKPGGSCSTSNLTDLSGSCYEEFIVSEKELINASNVKFSVALDPLMGGECAAKTDKTTNIYIMIEEAEKVSSETIPFQVDLLPPEIPEISDIIEGETNLIVLWTDTKNKTEEGLEYKIYYSDSDFDDTNKHLVKSVSGITAKSYQITGLKNNVEYFVAISAIDKNDNEGLLSARTKGTPVEVMDYFEYYKSLGGSEEGGCSIAKRGSGSAYYLGAVLLFIAFVLIGKLRLPKRQKVFFAAAPALFLWTNLYAESPQNMAIEIKVGPYLPNMDSEFSGVRIDGKNVAPFKEVFGDSPFLMSQIELDYQFYNGFGTIGLGFGAGYSYIHGKGLLKSGEKSSDSTAIHILPLNLSLVYRFDVLAKRFSFPFVLYGKGGFDYFIWWVTDGIGNVSSFEDASGKAYKGSGGTFGAHATAGLSLLLDLFAPSMAQIFDVEVGVNNSYLFAEAIFLFVDDFGKGKSFNFSDNLLLFGMAFEF